MSCTSCLSNNDIQTIDQVSVTCTTPYFHKDTLTPPSNMRFPPLEGGGPSTYAARDASLYNATFTPIVMSSTGGIGPCATVVLKRLGGLLAEKHAASYSSVMGLLRCRLSFALLRSSIMRIRWSRSSRWHPGRIDFTTTDLAVSEGNVSLH